VEGATGLIEYPKTRQRTTVTFDPTVEAAVVEGWVAEVSDLLASEQIPPVLHKPVCKSCSYQDFCYANEG
jgi:CRISPR-associated exonuclease Cas4